MFEAVHKQHLQGRASTRPFAWHGGWAACRLYNSKHPLATCQVAGLPAPWPAWCVEQGNCDVVEGVCHCWLTYKLCMCDMLKSKQVDRLVDEQAGKPFVTQVPRKDKCKCPFNSSIKINCACRCTPCWSISCRTKQLLQLSTLSCDM